MKVCYLYDVPFISFKYITDERMNERRRLGSQISDGIEVFKEKVSGEIKMNCSYSYGAEVGIYWY